MAAVTIKGIPDDVMDRLKTLAETERRSMNQQAIILLERALSEEPQSFDESYRRFEERHGPSPLAAGDLDDLRSSDSGRPVDL